MMSITTLEQTSSLACQVSLDLLNSLHKDQRFEESLLLECVKVELHWRDAGCLHIREVHFLKV